MSVCVSSEEHSCGFKRRRVELTGSRHNYRHGKYFMMLNKKIKSFRSAGCQGLSTSNILTHHSVNPYKTNWICWISAPLIRSHVPFIAVPLALWHFVAEQMSEEGIQHAEILQLSESEYTNCVPTLSHGIKLEILVLSVSSTQKIGHILFHTATAWHSVTEQHNALYRTRRQRFKGNYLVLRHCNRKSPVALCIFKCGCYIWIIFIMHRL